MTLIRSRPEVVREALRRRREDEALVDEVLAVDTRRRALVDERDNLRAEQNQASRGIGRSGKPSEADLQRLREMRERIRQLDEETTSVEADLDRLVLAFELGNYAYVREHAPELAEKSKDLRVRAAASELARRIEPDPLVKTLLAMSIALLVVLALWAYKTHGN